MEKAKDDNSKVNEKSVKGNGGIGCFAEYEVSFGRFPTRKVWKSLPKGELRLSILVE